MRETNYIGHAFVLTTLAAATLYFGIDLISMSENPYQW